MPSDGELRKLTAVEEVINMQYGRDVIELVSKGLGPMKIAEEIGCSYSTVKNLIDKFHAAYSFELQEYSEKLKIQTLARLDYMYSNSARFAYPMAADDPNNPLRKVNPETKEIESEFYEGNTTLLGIMLRVLKEQRAWYENEREASRHSDERHVNIEKVEVSIRQSSDLYQTALGSMQDDWMNPLLEMELNDIYELESKNDHEIGDFDKKLQEIEEKMAKNPDYEQNMKGINDDDED